MLRRLLAVALLVSLTAPLHAYIPIRKLISGNIVPSRWAASAFPITWKLNPAQGLNVTGARTLADVMRASFQTWVSVTTATISFLEGPATIMTDAARDNENIVSLVPLSSSFTSGALAFAVNFTSSTTGLILESDIIFNPATFFSTDLVTPTNQIDLQSTATHEIGHLLGLDHTGLMSATMFPTTVKGASFARTLSTDDIIGVSTIYPNSTFNTSRGSASGTVRTSTGAPVYGAFVVVVDANGTPVASTITDPSGNYRVDGLLPGSYTAYAEPLDAPLDFADVPTLNSIYPGSAPLTNFTTRFRP